MRSYKISPTTIETFYDFICPECKTKIYKTLEEVKHYKWDICCCGAQLIFVLPKEKDKVIIQEKNIVKKPILYNSSTSYNPSIPIKIKPKEIKKKKYDLDGYVGLLKGLGMKVGPAKVLIKQLIGMGLDPLDEANFTTELLKNI